MADELSIKSEQVLAKLDEIEAELKHMGYWSNNPPDLQAEIKAGKLRSYLDAPSFELWLQCIFLSNARTAARTMALPKQSQVGLMAMRQYDYHSHDDKAVNLLRLCREFDEIVNNE